MTGFDLAMVALVPVVIGAGIVFARWVAGRVLDRIERNARRLAEGERTLVDCPPVPFGELPESQVRVVMARRALVIDVNDLEGRN